MLFLKIRTVRSGLIRSHCVRKESYDTMLWCQIRKAFSGMAMLKIKRMDQRCFPTNHIKQNDINHVIL